MLIGTHTLSPVVAVAGVQIFRKMALKWRDLLWIGLAGAAPDLLNPHLSLESRLTSWSHSLVGFVAVIGVAVLICGFTRFLRWRVVGLMALAYLWHLFCDGIAGGIAYLYPFSDAAWGQYWVPAGTWIYFDLVFVLLTYLCFAVDRVRKVRGSLMV